MKGKELEWKRKD
jgi:hypothetical protein